MYLLETVLAGVGGGGRGGRGGREAEDAAARGGRESATAGRGAAGSGGVPRPPAPRCGRQRPRREDGEAGGGGGGHERWTSAGACGPQEPLARLAALFFYPQEAAAGSLQENRGVWANSTSARCNWTHHRPNPSRSKRPSPSRSPSEARDSPTRPTSSSRRRFRDAPAATSSAAIEDVAPIRARDGVRPRAPPSQQWIQPRLR